mgnify:CR=1 FL=1
MLFLSSGFDYICYFFYENFNMSEFTGRIDTGLKEKILKRMALCESLGIAPNSIAIWKSRGTIPSDDVCVKIADYLGSDLRWLITGEEMEAPFLTESEREVVGNMRAMDERGIAEMVEISRIKRASVAEKLSESAVG